MAERSTEVLVCGASIMKDVWEIRLRDYRQKSRLEDERLRRSALEKINQDWQARMSYKIKTLKRLERKSKPPEESSLQTFKVKQMNSRRPHRLESSRQADFKKKTKVNKLALLRRLNESCPGLMVWATSWKFSQPSGKNKETCIVSDWGKSWKFLNLQPNTEGKPWFELGFDNNNNMRSDGILFLCQRLGKAFNNQHLHQDIALEWEKSWVFKEKRKESHEDTTNDSWKKFYNPWESHHENDSEWHHSWKSTKSSNDLIQSISKEEDQKNDVRQYGLPWSTSWMYSDKQLHKKPNSLSHFGWNQSWSVSKTIAKQEKKSTCPQAIMPDERLHFNIFKVIVSLSGKMKHTMLKSSPLHGGHKHSPEWGKSWVTVKNLSEYKEETNKEENTEKNLMEEPKKVPMNIPECQHVKFDVLALPQKLNKSVNLLEQNKRETHAFNWKDSWKMLKHQHKEQMGLRNQRHPTLHLSATLQTSDWANSRKFTNLTLNQDINSWQQAWSTYNQPRFNRRVREPDELNENITYNGPLGVHGWGECWRSTRHQYQLERQNADVSNHPINPQVYMRSVTDWEQSWQSSSNQHRHDRPSMVEWLGAWRFFCDNLGDLKNTSMEIKGENKIYSTSYKSTFRQRCPSKLWNESWTIRKRSAGTGSCDLIARAILDWDHSWMFTDFYRRHGDHYVNDVPARMPKAVQIESKSEWGRSWKISNPQPPKNIALWMHAKPRSFSAQDLLLWTRSKHNHLLPSLPKEPNNLKIWRTSWMLTKMESNQGFNSPADESLINVKTKMRKHKYSIDKHKPQQKRWNDACKLSKTQPRPKHDARHKAGKDKCENGQGMFAQWIESWRFSKSHVERSVSLSDWKSSWKFLLDPYV